MHSYSSEFISDSHNYSIVKTEAIYRIGSSNLMSHENITQPLEWIFRQTRYAPSLLQPNYYTPRSLETQPDHNSHKISNEKKLGDHKDKYKGKGKGKKCVQTLKKIRGGKKYFKKYLTPIILGVVAAKSLLLPAALKAIAFMSAKGLMMGFFSTLLASLLSLKGIFDQSLIYLNRNDNNKSRVEIVHVPTKLNDHYYDDYYKRKDNTQVRNNKI